MPGEKARKLFLCSQKNLPDRTRESAEDIGVEKEWKFHGEQRFSKKKKKRCGRLSRGESFKPGQGKETRVPKKGLLMGGMGRKEGVLSEGIEDDSARREERQREKVKVLPT